MSNICKKAKCYAIITATFLNKKKEFIREVISTNKIFTIIGIALLFLVLAAIIFVTAELLSGRRRIKKGCPPVITVMGIIMVILSCLPIKTIGRAVTVLFFSVITLFVAIFKMTET